jgi:type IV secretion system protein TrbL
MNDTGVIDQFLQVFSTYIDSGFGLLGGEAGFLSSTLIVIDVTIAALFWAWGADEDVLQRLIKKTLYIGVFAFIIGNFSALASILLNSFAGLGLKASGGMLAIGDFMRPGVVAATGLDAGEPLLDATENLMGPVGFFSNFAQIAILLVAWVIVVLAFFILAVQIFVTILEFKLVTLAGFVLLPFAFFGRTAFMAERVLGHVISSGIKVLVLAVITGIGTTLFDRFLEAGIGAEPDIEQAMAIALGALTLLGLGIFGPGIANGIVAGGPQLGAGAAAGTTMAAGATFAAGAAGATLAGGAAATTLGRTALGGARAAGGASAAYARGAAGREGAAAFGGGMAKVGGAAAHAAAAPVRKAVNRVRASYAEGRAGSESVGGASGAVSAGAPPAWAKALRRRQAMAQGTTIVAHSIRSGDGHGAGSAPDTSEKE